MILMFRTTSNQRSGRKFLAVLERPISGHENTIFLKNEKDYKKDVMNLNRTLSAWLTFSNSLVRVNAELFTIK